jgi:phosphoglycolate phosphatase
MSAARSFDLIIFDLDGTLADTAPDIALALNRTLVEAALPSLSIDTIIGYVGDGAAKLIERALPPAERGRDIAPLLERFLAHYEERPCVESRLFSGVAALLDALAAEGVGTAVLTNKAGVLARLLLDALLPAHRFVAVIGDRDGFPHKPDPTGARAIVQRAATSVARTIVVGDGIPDMRLARALGARAIAAAWGYAPRASLAAESPTWIAAKPEDALQLLQLTS